ncbi:hypothetical protein ONS96_004663 [Cadophora gregata f. sp. sojae]|nr:hypothetical protein ONS96_004663 [Cadophora gregata f. sp. sojae]
MKDTKFEGRHGRGEVMTAHYDSGNQALIISIETHVEKFTDDPYGQIQAGIVTLQGRIFPVQPRSFSRQEALNKSGINFWSSQEFKIVEQLCFLRWDTWIDEKEFNAGLPVYWVPIVRKIRGSQGEGSTDLQGLLLRKVDSTNQEYIRVSLFQLVSKSEGDPADLFFRNDFTSRQQEILKIH